VAVDGCNCDICRASRAEPDGPYARARELLFSFLNEEQQREYETYGRFHVISHDGKRRYKLRCDYAPTYVGPSKAEFKVGCRYGYEKQKVTVWPGSNYCVHMHNVPQDDYNLAIAMLLSSQKGEEYFHSIANW